MVEAGAVVTAEAIVTADHDRLSREIGVLNVLREEQGAPETAGALSGTEVHHHRLKVGSEVQHQMKEVHMINVAHLQGTGGRLMDQSTVAVQGERAEAL